MTAVQLLLTVADLDALPDDGKRYELLDGELAVSPAPVPTHQRTVGKTYIFLNRAEDAGYGLVYVAPVDVYFDEHSQAQPDVLFIRQERLQIVRKTRIEGAPDLVVEVLSPGTRSRDLRVKMQIYARFGVPFYWVLDPAPRTAQVYELAGGQYVARPLLRAGDTLSCPLFPGIATTVRELFR